ncbi:MAG: hypothetical protein F4102_04930, partial [Chloroflexi bacterium]|nr:hypothetical protein [Chloroflexota bacterium]
SAVTVVTGSEGDGDAPPISWDAVAAVGGTIVLMMGWRNFDEIVVRLTEAGLSPTTPAAAIEQAWTGSQRAVFAPLGELRGQAGEMSPPVTVVIGETARLATPEVSWTIPGRRILVTRPRAQMPPLVERLRAFNAEVIELPTIEIKPVDPAPIDAAVGRLAAGSYDIVCLTSVNGVQALWEALRRNELDARVFSAAQVAAIGSETARALEERGITPDLVPETFTSQALANELTRRDLRGRPVLLARAARGNPLLAERLRKAGAEVEDLALYDVVTPSADRETLRELESGLDVVTLTSPSTADGLAKLVRGRVDLDSLQVVCIGPVTAEAAARLGFPVVGVAQCHTISGLAEAVGRYLSSLPPAEPESADSP